MKLQTLLFGVRFFTVVTLGALGGVILSIDPREAGAPGVVLFFVSLFASVTGMLVLLLIFLTRKFLGDEAAAVSFGGSFRQAVLLSGFVAGALLLSRVGLLAWWTGALLFASVLLLELSARRLSEPKE